MLLESTNSKLANISYKFHSNHLTKPANEINLMLMQTFYDFWFSEATFPSIQSYESLIRTIHYFTERFFSIESKTNQDVIRINSLYTAFSKNIFSLLSTETINQEDCLKLQPFLNDDAFFACFIKVFLRIVVKDYEASFNRYFLALSKVYKAVFDEKDSIMLLFKKCFLDYLMIAYGHLSQREQRIDNKNNMKGIERIMRRVLDWAADKRDKNYEDMKNCIVKYFAEYEVDLLHEEKEIKAESIEKKPGSSRGLENDAGEDKILGKKRLRARKKSKNDEVNVKAEKDAKEKEEVTVESKKSRISKEKKKVSERLAAKRKGRPKKDKINVKRGKPHAKGKEQEESNVKEEEEESDVEEEEEEEEVVEEEEEEDKTLKAGKKRKIKTPSKSPAKANQKKIPKKKSPPKKAPAKPPSTTRSGRRIMSQATEPTNSPIKTNQTKTEPKRLSTDQPTKPQTTAMTTRGRKVKEVNPPITAEKAPIKESPNKVSVTKSKKGKKMANIVPVKLTEDSPKPKSILKKEKKFTSPAKAKKQATPSPKHNQRTSSRKSASKTPTPTKKKESEKKTSNNKFYQELEEKYKKDKRKSPRKFNITPMKVNKKAKEDLKNTITKTKQKMDLDQLLKPKYDFLGKKRNISFSSDRLVKEFDPKTPVKEIVTRSSRRSPMDKKKRSKQKK